MRLKEYYQKEVMPKMKEKFSFSNDMQVPRLEKVVLNVGFGRHSKEKEYVAQVVKTLEDITGQKPLLTKAKVSVSAFKVREGMTIGARVTLRQQKMYDFLEKLLNVSFPRVRDFRGINAKSIDKTGCLTIGFKEQIAFPEIRAERIDHVHGLEVSIVADTKNYEEGLELFTLLGFPFKK